MRIAFIVSLLFVAAGNAVAGEAELDALDKALGRSKATNDELIVYVDVIASEFGSLTPKAQRRAESLFLKAARLMKRDRAGQNTREGVNVAGAKALAATAPHLEVKERARLSRKIRSLLSGRHFDRDDPLPSDELVQAMFAALGRLNDVASLEWIGDRFLHTKKQPLEIQRLVAAHRAIPMFRDVPGRLRHDLCRKMVTIYQSVEALAEQSSTDPAVRAAKRLWDRIRTATIAAVQFLAHAPTDEEGVALATMAEFQAWMRDHKSVRRPPWVDVKATVR